MSVPLPKVQTETKTHAGFEPIRKKGFEIYYHKTPTQGIKFAYFLASQVLNRHSVAVLTHGDWLLDLYKMFAKFDSVEPCAILMGEEILGEPFHFHSIEREWQRKGIIQALSKRGVPFHRILSRAPTLTTVMRIYSSHFEAIMRNGESSHGFIEVRPDGSLGAISQSVHDYHDENFSKIKEIYDYVMGYENKEEIPLSGKKVCLSYKALDEIDNLWVFSFGKDSRSVLKKVMQDKEPKEYCPACYLRNYNGHVKLFTDQKIG